jgi:hypothetical protein
MTPQQFLRQLGLSKKPTLDPKSDEFLAAIERAGMDPSTGIGQDGFGPVIGNMLFATEEIGRATLSEDFDWYRGQIEDLERLRAIPPNAKRIAEMGSGAGILSLWLAHRHLSAFCPLPWQIIRAT